MTAPTNMKAGGWLGRPSVGEPGYLPYCGNCPSLQRMSRGTHCFKCHRCGMETRIVNGEDMFDRTAPRAAQDDLEAQVISEAMK